MNAQRNRLTPDARGEQILVTALQIACTDGIDAVTTRAISKRLGIARSLVSHYYTWDTLRDLVIMRAASVGCVRVVARAVASDETLAPRIGEDAYNRAMLYLMSGKKCPSDCKHTGCKLSP